MRAQPQLPFQKHSETSRAAAKAAVSQAETDRQLVLDFLIERGRHGATDEEIRDGTGVGENSHRARRVALCRDGLVEEACDVFGVKIKRPTSSGRAATVWVFKGVK